MQSRQGPVDSEQGRTSAETTRNLADTPRRGARTRPDSVVLESAGATRTWRELWERSLRVANGLRATGVTPRARPHGSTVQKAKNVLTGDSGYRPLSRHFDQLTPAL